MRFLCAQLGRLTGHAAARASLGIVEHDECIKFHVDRVGLRLVCTYIGPGTELVPDEAVDRRFLSCEGDAAELNRRIAPKPEKIVRARGGDIVLLKGECWPGNAGAGAVHRSPPIQGSGIKRLVLKLDVGPDVRC